MRLSICSICCIIIFMLSAACGGNHDSDHATAKKTSAGRGNKSAVTEIRDPWTADSIAYLRWGSPASPYRDENRYIAFLDSLLAIDTLPEDLRERAEYRRKVAMMNRPGTIAADFLYSDRHGHKSRLHDLKSSLTLLIFYDPECPHCDDILRSLAHSETLNKAIAEKHLTVLAIYAEGKREIWNKSLEELPVNWLVGYDLTGILDQELYDLPAMPTPYLLSVDKQVILKDPTPRQLIEYISEISDDSKPINK